MCKKLTDNWLAMTGCRPLFSHTARHLDLWTVEEKTATIDVKDIEGFCCCFFVAKLEHQQISHLQELKQKKGYASQQIIQ